MKYETKKLKDIATIKTGKLDSNAAVQSGKYPFFTCDPTTLRINDWAYDTEAVLLAGNNASGNFTAKYYNGRFNAYQRTYIIETADRNKLLVRFLCYAMNQQLRFLKTMSSGSATKFLTTKILHELDIPCPDFDIQNKIVRVLGTIEDLIENNQKQIKLLEEAAQRLYKEWFVDLRFPGYEDVTVVDGVPEGWKVFQVRDTCSIFGGGTPSTKVSEYYINGNISWATPTDITNSFSMVLLDTAVKITKSGFKNCSSKMLPPEAILMTSRASVGFFGVCDHEICTNQGFISCVPFKPEMQMYLLFNLMNRVNEIRNIAGGSTYLEISKRTFGNLQIVVPADSILTKFQTIAHRYLDQMRTMTKIIAELTEARDRLLPKLMSGELGV